MHTVALVGTDGALDWLRAPHFASPGVFAAILDGAKDGYCQGRACLTCKHLCCPKTNT